MWHNVITQEDINDLLKQTDWFHDSCIKEMAYLSGAYVTDALDMYPVNDLRELRVLILRQKEDFPAIELVFQDVLFFYVSPNNPDYTSEILEARIFIKNDRIFWTNADSPVVLNEDENGGVLICAKKLLWRIVDHRGDGRYYQSLNNQNPKTEL